MGFLDVYSFVTVMNSGLLGYTQRVTVLNSRG